MAEKGGFSVSDTGFLLSADSDACAWGATTWIPLNGSWRATWPVASTRYPEDELQLQMLVRPLRPSEPTVVYLCRGDNMCRVDVNGGHRGQRFTHIQGAQATGHDETTRPVPDDFIEVEHEPTVHDGTYHRVLQDSAKVLYIDVSGVDWTDPPEGVAR